MWLQEEDDLIYQIVVLHDDEYVRTYTVNHKEFEVIKDSGSYDQSTDAKFKGTECMILDKKTSISEARMHKVRIGLAAASVHARLAVHTRTTRCR